MSEWQPIQTAPKDGRFLLLFVAKPGVWCPTIARWNDGRKRSLADNRPLEKGWGDEIMTFHLPDVGNMPTHWMPLPDPPSEGEGG